MAYRAIVRWVCLLPSESDCGRLLRALGSLYLARFELPGALRSDDVQTGRIGFYDAYDRGAGGNSRRLIGALSYERQGGAAHVRATLFGGYRRLGLLENFTGYLLDPAAGDRRLGIDGVVLQPK